MRNHKWQIAATVIFIGCYLCFCNTHAASFTKADIDKELKAFQCYDYQMSPEPLNNIKEMVRQCYGQEEYRRYLEQQMIKFLDSDATVAARRFICQQLWIIGSAESVPMLRKMLAEQETAEMACFALRENPSPQAAEALREGLMRSQGGARIQIINMLGLRRDQQSVPALKELLSNDDEAIVLSSVVALGKIGGKDAIDALAAFRSSTNPEIKAVVDEAYLQYAKALASDGDTAQALSIYEMITKESKSELMRRAAILGVINNIGGQKAVSCAMSILDGSDSFVKAAVIANSHLLEGQQVTGQLITKLSELNPYEKSLLIDVLAKREIELVRPVITEMCKDPGESVRLAALKALGIVGDASSVKRLCEAISENRGIKEEDTALASLTRIKGPGVEEAIIGCMENSDVQIRPKLIKIISGRRITGSTPALIKQLSSPDSGVLKAAYKALKELATEKELPVVIESVINIQDESIRKESEKAVAAIANKINDETRRADTVLAVLRDEERIAVKCSLLRILGSIANEDALETLREALKDKDEQIQKTAIRELAAWPNTKATPVLLEVLKTCSNESFRILAFRGYVRLIGLPSDRPIAETLEMYEEAIKFADSAEQKKLVLGGLANVASPEALKIIQTYLDDTAVSFEASVAIDKLIDKIEAVPLFDGKTFDGWEGNFKTFRIENGAIVAGSLEKPNPKSAYLCTMKQYGDFQLKAIAKLVGRGDNGGIQFRGSRVPNSNEMDGYQADMGSLPGRDNTRLWGCLYDANRHKLLVMVDQRKLAEVFKPNEWNEIVVRCLGGHIQIWVNGYQTIDYTEPDKSRKQSGSIGLQVHKGPPTKVWYRDIEIKALDL